MSFISDQMVEKALDFIRDHAEEYGRLRGLAKGLDHERKIVRGQMFLESCEKTAAAKEADAESSQEYQNIVKEIVQVETDLAIVSTQIKAAELKIEVWRSLNARQGRGHI